MGEKAILKVQRKIRVTAGDDSNQVVLEGLDSALRRVCSVQVGGYNMKFYSLAVHIILEASWTFVVKHLELGAKAPIGELGMEDRVGSDELCFTSRFYRLGDDCVAVLVVEDYEVLASATGGDREAASLVSGCFASQFNCFNIHLMGSGWGRMLAWEDKRSIGD